MAKNNPLIVLEDDFHGTEIRVRESSRDLLFAYEYDLTASQRRTVRKIRDTLCGSDDCVCGVVR